MPHADDFESFDALLRRMSSPEVGAVIAATEELGEMARRLSPALSDQALDALCSTFWIDTVDRPDLIPAVDKAVDVVASFGAMAVPRLVADIAEADMKSVFHYARAIAAIGVTALEPLMAVYSRASDPVMRSFCLYALSKMRHEAVGREVPVVLLALEDDNREVRDTAARTIGKLAEVVRPELVPEVRRAHAFDRLMRLVSEQNPGVRSKAVRSLGKLARCGWLDEAQRGRVRDTLRALVGDEAPLVDPDRSFIVRREADEALGYLSDT